MSMSKKDYKAIAKVIKRYNPNEMGYAHSLINEMIHDLCDYFQQDNPRFDKDKFIVACYPDNETP